MNSVWTQQIRLPSFPPLTQSKKTDVLIIGGGIAGLLCAHMLSCADVDCVLVEADRICNGITKNTTAKITLQHGPVYSKLIRQFGIGAAYRYLEANQQALEEYRTLCANIGCDFEIQDNILYSRTDPATVREEYAALKSLGMDATFTTDLSLPFSVVGAIRLQTQAQFHPLKFLTELARPLPIWEHTKVLKLFPGKAVTASGTIDANHIIVATHFPFLNSHGSYFLKLYQHRSYVLALENAPLPDGMYADEAMTGLSFRRWENLLLLGGGGHRTGKEGGGWKELEDFAHQHYPKARTVSRWATQDCLTLDGIPYVGQYSKRTPGLYVATGFNKWGMTSSMVAARLLTDLILKRENPCASLLSPSRTMLRPQLALNLAESALHLLKPTTPRCPHMGCALKYNPQEHSWDCPCHGSRFTEQGNLIDNPAIRDKTL